MTAMAATSRVAFSPGEFAALFGKSQTWGYRQIYAGKVKAVTEYGRILVPAVEVDSILQKAGVYDGLKSKPKKSKAEILKLTPNLQNAWKGFLAARRQLSAETKALPSAMKAKPKWPAPALGRQAALARLAGKRGSARKSG